MTGGAVSALEDMLSGMQPELAPYPYKYAKVSALGLMLFGLLSFARTFAIVSEDEGITQIKETTAADKGPLFARITLQVHSDLEGVGLTAAVSNALADQAIACNVIAARHHDHLLVPWEKREEAMDILLALSAKHG